MFIQIYQSLAEILILIQSYPDLLLPTTSLINYFSLSGAWLLKPPLLALHTWVRSYCPPSSSAPALASLTAPPSGYQRNWPTGAPSSSGKPFSCPLAFLLQHLLYEVYIHLLYHWCYKKTFKNSLFKANIYVSGHTTSRFDAVTQQRAKKSTMNLCTIALIKTKMSRISCCGYFNQNKQEQTTTFPSKCFHCCLNHFFLPPLSFSAKWMTAPLFML